MSKLSGAVRSWMAWLNVRCPSVYYMCAVAWLFAAGAAAQSLVVDTTSIAVSADAGFWAPQVLVNVTSSGAHITGIVVSAATDTGASWLRVYRDYDDTPAVVGVYCNATSLSAGTYHGTVTITATGVSSVIIPVTFTVRGSASSGSLSVDQASLSFSGQASGTAPASQQLNVSSTSSGTTFSVTVATASGSWLQVSAASGTAPAAISVSVTTTGLSAGNYLGSVIITPASGSAITIPVSLTVTVASGLTVSATSLQFSYVSGGSQPAAQSFNITNSATSVGFSTAVTVAQGSGWLAATPTSGTTPQVVTVTVAPSGLSAGVYHGTVTVSVPSVVNASVNVSVTLTVSTSGAVGLQTDSASLSFSGQVNGSSPAAQSLAVNSNPTGVTFSASATTSSGGSWLQLSATATTAPATISVSVNLSGLAAGTYSGTITLTPATGAAIAVSVSLTVSPSSGISASVSSLRFYYTVGATTPAAQSITINGSATVSVTGVSASTDVGTWLSASPASGILPFQLAVSVSPAGMSVGNYTGKVSALISDGSTVDIPVTLIVSTTPLLVVGTSPSTFVYQPGGAVPSSQTVSITSSAYTIPFAASVSTIDGSSWLSVSPAVGSTPQNIVISVNPGTLAAGSYSGTVTVAAVNAANSPVTIPITLTVTSSILVPGVLGIDFNYQVGGVNQVLTQPVTVTAFTGEALSVAAAAQTANCGSGWLQVSPTTFTTPATINITFVPTGMSTVQACAGDIVLTSNGLSKAISVGVTVATTPLVNVTPLSLTLYAPWQTQSTSQTIEVSTTDNSLPSFTYGVLTASGGWLSVSRKDASTKSTLTVVAAPGTLAVGTYSGIITISSPNLTHSLWVPVTFVVTPAAAVTASPSSLTFTQTVGGTPPAPQAVTLATVGGVFPFTASVVQGMSGSSVLSVTPASGTTTAGLSVSVAQNTLAAGTYTGAIAITIPAADSKPLTVPVTISVANVPSGAAVAATPTSLSFTVQQGGAAPSDQQINLTSTGGVFNIATTVAQGSKWLSIKPSSVTTPGSVTVSVNPSGLSAGNYNDTVVLTSAGVLSTPISIPVQLSVTPVVVSSPQISAIANAASGVRGSIAPGEMVAITGDSLGPDTGVSYTLPTSGNTLSTTLGNTQVLFNGIAAPLLFVSATQINAIVPYDVAGQGTVTVTIVKQGIQSEAYTMQVAAAAPGLFTVSQDGKGPASILNADNGVNGLLPPALPAKRGSVVQVFGTGEGIVQPSVATGSVIDGIHVPVSDVTATVGGLPADVVFAGAAPQALDGTFQVNVRIPANTLAGNVPIVITIGGVSSQTGVTVAVSGWF